MKTIMKKVKENKAIILKLLSLLLMLAVISVITMLILFATDVLSYDGGFKFNQHILDAFTGKWYGFIALMFIQMLLSMLLCAIPGVAAGFVMISSEVLYAGRPVMAFLFSYSCVVVASAILYLLGRFGGYKICEKLLGKEDCDKSLDLLRTRGTSYFPLMMLFPIFPDDALVMIAGTTRMKLRWFIPSIIICRGIGAATIVFGMDMIPFDTFTTVFDWMVLFSACFFWIQQLFKIANRVDHYFQDKNRLDDEDGAPVKTHTNRNYIKIYFNASAVLLSAILPIIYLKDNITIYFWFVLTTVCFLWIKEMLTAIANLIIYVRNKKDALSGMFYDESNKDESVNTFHTIATFIICIGIAVIHFNIFRSVIKLLALVSISFFWLRETFRLANKIDHYLARKRLTNDAKLHGATVQTLEESLNSK